MSQAIGLAVRSVCPCASMTQHISSGKRLVSPTDISIALENREFRSALLRAGSGAGLRCRASAKPWSLVALSIFAHLHLLCNIQHPKAQPTPSFVGAGRGRCSVCFASCSFKESIKGFSLFQDAHFLDAKRAPNTNL